MAARKPELDKIFRSRLSSAYDGRNFRRCADCNRPLEPVEASEVAGRIPEDVLEQQLPLHRCPGCDRLFWPGSHTDRMRAFVDSVLAEARRAPTGLSPPSR